ncbi:DUF6286 domain-containing protein [Streptomyces bacillaris]|uniref:DUF6286 domain-containing protein n=2 Tax=Streptomyces cavourensis TaxID=67258 RepID=A0ABY5FBZ2_9ACTN|nr:MULTISPECIES: DUF6286 domain-containing protein [Streptomyces]TQO29386.1 hypothetical protein FHX79_111194 [Streptomyces cavourensis]UTR81232.1 DUF6286 domain-containing protein [Streptomyces cavourensis]WAE65388.1 DUF6286 domain-containing protein [Streptomyces cavourensis]GGU86372.1 hypothetical protein GCM10010498_50740 [Streptomyces cavourensis]
MTTDPTDPTTPVAPDDPMGSTGSTRRMPTVDRAGGDPGPPDPGSPPDHEPVPTLDQGGGGRAGRFWSARRVPAALLALVLLGAAGLLLYDIAAVRAGHPAMQWRRSLADGLAERQLDDVAVLVGAGVAAAIGLWLLLLALTPGLRDLLPMRRDRTEVRAGLDRTAAALVLRDRAVEVPGVQSVRVRMGRRRAKVRALSHFRGIDDVRTDLEAVLARAVGELGLAKPPGLSVRVDRPARKG